MSVGLMGATLYLIFLWVPTELNLGVSQRIFYFHLPLGWLGMVSIVLVAASSLMYLLTVERSGTAWPTRRRSWASYSRA